MDLKHGYDIERSISTLKVVVNIIIGSSIAVAPAKHALTDDSERQKFEEMAKKEGKESTHSVAIAYFCKQIRNKDSKS